MAWHLSRTGHVEAGLNPGGPSPKAKYSLATDSEPSSASERWEEPRQGEDTEPETTCLQAVRARLSSLGLATLLNRQGDKEKGRHGEKTQAVFLPVSLSPLLLVCLKGSLIRD